MNETIDAEKLCALTGLTDRRHRQLAKEGYFPTPVRGLYQLTATIAGMFRYYRESYQKLNRTLVDDKQTKLRKEIELLELKIAEQQKQLVPVSEVDRVWQAVTAAVRQTLIALDVPHTAKEDLVAHFRQIKVSEYYRKSSDSKGTGSSETDSAAADS
jgi:hypothetical protein